MVDYCPQKGDFVVVNFNPQSGHEQKGRRPALVVSNKLFNQATGMAMVCPITNTSRKIPFHVRVNDKSSLTGFVMVEQMKSIDYKARKVKFIEKAHQHIVDDVLSLLDACIYQG
ncbi:MAG: type II toxin-antitoxin system PemK/MazF family toxin [Proteobacteria bacterium]|nr:type II toxin-antitoxin system PemK/MazF family toxin [Pseudomonadota bacterium]